MQHAAAASSNGVVRRLYGAIRWGTKKGKEVGNWGLRLKREKKEKKTLYSRIFKGKELVSVVWEVGLKHRTIPTRLLAETATG